MKITVKDLVRTDRTLAGQIRDFFEDFYNTIVEQLSRVSYDGNRLEAQAIAGDADTIRTIADLFNAALEGADGRPELDGGIRFSAKDSESSKIKNQIAAARSELDVMNPVAEISSGGRPKRDKRADTAKMRAKLLEHYGSKNYTVDRKGFGVVFFDDNALAQLASYINDDAEFAAAKAAPLVVKRGIEVDHHVQHKGRNGVQSWTFAAPVVLNGKLGYEGVVVQKTNRLKPHAVRIILPDGSGFNLDKTYKAAYTSERPSEMTAGYRPVEAASDVSISHEFAKINTPEPINMMGLVLNSESEVRESRKAGKPSLIDEVVNPGGDYKAEYQAEQQSLPAEESTLDVERTLANEAELERVKAENERLSGLVSSLKEQMKITKGYRPNEKALTRVARNILKQTAGRALWIGENEIEYG